MVTIPSAARDIFLAALQHATLPERAAFVADACGGDESLRAHVEALLAAHDEPDSRFDHLTVNQNAGPESPPVSEMSDWIGLEVGPYKLRELLGEGGMGVVYVAEQTEPLCRKVALKIIKPGMDSRQVIARFEAERQALALMDHPNIARILDAGTVGERSRQTPSAVASDGGTRSVPTTAGRPYFVMELVCGMPITEYCDQAGLHPRQRLELFVDVCQAVQHAHQKGIIHRDLKPSNILVTLHDGVPVVKVIDFGVAKALNQQLTERTLYTGVAQLIGTPLYMSPEQAEMSGLDIDTRSDVYSLGVLLYELLTGQTPFDKDQLSSAGFDEMRRLIREVDPPRPSQRLSTLDAQASSTVSQCRGLDGRQLHRTLRSELDWIVMRCLEKDRNRRYESASAIARDVENYLGNQPIAARPSSTAYRVRKWFRRHPTTAIVTVVALLGVAALSVGGWYYNHQLHEVSVALNSAHSDRTSAINDSKRLHSEVVERDRRLRLQAYGDEIRAAWQAWEAGESIAALNFLMRHQPQSGEEDLRGFEWHLLNAHWPSPIHTLRGHEHAILSADVSADDQWIASSDKLGTVKIWEFATGREVKSLQYSGREVTCVRFAPDGQTLATAGMDRLVHLWRVSDWSETAAIRGGEHTITRLAWSPDGKQIAYGGFDNKLFLWSGDQPDQTRTLAEYPGVVRGVEWSPDGKHLAVTSEKGGLCLWDTTAWESFKLAQDAGEGDALALDFTADGKWLASAGYFGHLAIHDVAKRTLVSYQKLPGGVGSLRFSPDDKQLLLGMFDGSVLSCQMETSSGQLLKTEKFLLGQGWVKAIAFAERGQTVVTASEKGRVVEVRRAAQFVIPQQFKYLARCFSISPTLDRACLLSPATGVARLVSFPAGNSFGRLALPKGQKARDASFLPPEDRLALLGSKTIQLFDGHDHRRVVSLPDAKGNLQQLTISPDGKLIAGSSSKGKIHKYTIWQADTSAAIRSHEAARDTNGVRLAFSPDNRLLATADSLVPTIYLWNIATGESVAELAEPEVYDLEFSPDGLTLAAAAGNNVSLWDVRALKKTAMLRGHTSVCRHLAFFPDGRTLVSVSKDQSARLWHIPSLQELCVLTQHSRPLWRVQVLSPRQIALFSSPDPDSPDSANDVLLFDTVARVNLPTPSRPELVRIHQLVEQVVQKDAPTTEQDLALLDQLGDLLGDDPRRSLDASLRIGELLLARKEQSVALTVYDEIVACFPNDPRGVAARGHCHFQRGDFESARRDFSTAIQLATANKLDPDHQTLVCRGFTHCRLQQFNHALADFEAACEVAPLPTLSLLLAGFKGSGPTPAVPDPQLRAGILALINKTADPGSVETIRFHRARGGLFAAFACLPEALSELQLAVAKSPPPQDGAAAVQLLEDYKRLGILAAALDDNEAYRKCCNELVSRLRDAQLSARNRTYIPWICALRPHALDDYSQAIQIARESLAADPDLLFQRMTLGAILMRAGNATEGHQLLTDAAAPTATGSNSSLRSYRHLLMAMSLHQQKQLSTGRAEVAKADALNAQRAQVPADWAVRLTLELLRREAVALVGSPPPDAAEPAKPKKPSAKKTAK